MRRIVVAAVAALAVLTALWYGHAPPRSATGYGMQAGQTVEFLRSQVQTAQLWVETTARGDATHQAAAVGLAEAESDATATVDRFAGLDPPAGTDDIRATVIVLGDAVTDELAAVRIAANREQWADLPRIAAALPALADRLDQVRRELPT